MDSLEKYWLRPWEGIASISRKLEQKQAPGPEDLEIILPFTNLTAPARATALLLKKTLPGLLGPELDHLVLLRNGTDLLPPAFLFRHRDGFLVSIDRLELPPDKLAELFSLSQKANLSQIETQISAQIKSDLKLGWVVVINPEFFFLLEKAGQEFISSRSLTHYQIDLLSVFKKAGELKLLEFFPSPPLFARVEEFLTQITDFDPQALKTIIPSSPEGSFCLGLTDPEFNLAFHLNPENPSRVAVSLDPQAGGSLSPSAAARRLRKVSGSRMAVCFELEPVRDLIVKLVSHPLPWQKEELLSPLKKLIQLIQGYGRNWSINPVPLPLKSWLRGLTRLFRLPYDISRLDDEFLPGTILEGISLGVGGHSQHAIILLDQKEIKGILVLELFRSGVRKIKFLSGKEIPPPRDPGRIEWLKETKFALWDQAGWMNYAIAIDLSLLRELNQALAGKEFSSLTKSPWLLLRLGRIISKFKQDEFIFYPNLMLDTLGKFIQKEGILSIGYRLLQAAFKRDRPRPRGLLYVRETIIAGLVILLGIILFLIL
ncbi:MAG: hypothetical protein NT056_03245 [Proteobacteria bacterium]|nr:hypothetical protein [Pseudomonadota bacterium]